MNSQTYQLYLAAFGLALLTSLGGVFIASRKPEWYTRNKISNFVAIGAGVLFALVITEFLPRVYKAETPWTPLLIPLGVLIIIFMETYVAPKLSFFEGQKCTHDHQRDHDHKHHHNEEHMHHLVSHKAACSAAGCLLVCAFFDGLQIHAAFGISALTGWMTSLGLAFHILPDGVLAATIALAGGMTKKAARRVALLTGSAIVVGTFTALFIDQVISFQKVILPLASGALLYVTFIHLLPVALHKRTGFLWMTLGCLFIFSLFHFGLHTH